MPASPEIRLTAHRLTFRCRATTALAMPHFAGSAVRGSLLSALRMQVCSLHGAGRSDGQEHLAGCPVCDFIAPVDNEAARGQDVVRLFTVEPPLDVAGTHPPGWSFSFGLTLFGAATALFPYVAVAAQTMGKSGLGRRNIAPGRFEVWECWAENPLAGRSERIMDANSPQLRMPPLPIDHEAVLARARLLQQVCCHGAESHCIQVHFLTPTRLIADGHLSAAPHFSILLKRILRRVSDLCSATGVDVPAAQFQTLLGRAETVTIARNHTRWVDLTSTSGRTRHATPIGGLIGGVVYEGDLGPFLPWLVWGEIAHVGKDATKGNGWYRLSRVTPA